MNHTGNSNNILKNCFHCFNMFQNCFNVFEHCFNMLSKSKITHVLQILKYRCEQYLKETTVHGLHYLTDSRNIYEKIVWVIAISFGFVVAITMIYSSLSDSYNDPILTSVHIIPIQKVYISLSKTYIYILDFVVIHRY